MYFDFRTYFFDLKLEQIGVGQEMLREAQLQFKNKKWIQIKIYMKNIWKFTCQNQIYIWNEIMTFENENSHFQIKFTEYFKI